MIQHTIFTNWHFMRWLKLGFGVYIAIQALQTHDTLAGFISAFFLFQAFTNTGCCGANGCDVVENKKPKDSIEEISFEEIKPSVPRVNKIKKIEY